MYLTLNHYNFDVYKDSIDILDNCYLITDLLPTHERFTIVQQVRRAALSVVLNISEGASRISAQERKRFYEVARSSLVEVDTALGICIRRKYVSAADTDETGSIIIRCFKRLSTMINTLSKQ